MLCLFYIRGGGWSLPLFGASRAINQIREIFAGAFNNTTQAGQVLWIVKRHASGNRKESRDLPGFAAQGLHLRCAPAPRSMLELARPGWHKLLFFFGALRQ